MRVAINVLTICVLFAIGLGTYYIFLHPKERTAYFYNQKVFDQFKGKLELESRLSKEMMRSKEGLDSLRVLIENGRLDLSSAYNEQLQQATTAQQQLSERFTADIWKYINEEVANFGDERGYDYIFGASGNGSLMYADSIHDITNEIVEFLNKKYGH